MRIEKHATIQDSASISHHKSNLLMIVVSETLRELKLPELPEVETVRRGLTPYLQGARIERVELRRENLRFAFPENFAHHLTGSTVTHIGRRAKFLVITLDNDMVLISHLGMSGSYHVEPKKNGEKAPQNEPRYHATARMAAHDHVVFHTRNEKGRAVITYNDPRRFGYMDIVPTQDLNTCRHFANVGIEPTGNALNGTAINHLFQAKKAPLKAALLDQSLIAGLGNIYVCEALWQSGLSPRRSAASITSKSKPATKRTEVLASNIRDVIDRAIAAGGSTLQDHRSPDGTLGYFQHNFAVYDREGEDCKKADCNGKISRIVQSGRSTFYCRSCQR